MGIGAAIIGGAVSLIGGSRSSKAAQQASAAQAAAAEKAAELQYQATQDTIKAQQAATQQGRRDAYPWAIAGSQALYRYMDELGVPMPTDPILPDLYSGPLGSQYGGTDELQTQLSEAESRLSRLQDSGGMDFDQVEGLNDLPWLGNIVKGAIGGAPGQFGDLFGGGGNIDEAQAEVDRLRAQMEEANKPIEFTQAKGFQETPGYEFQVEQGEKGVLNNLAALGMKNSGAALKALTRFRTGVANQEYNNYLNRLSGAAGMGQSQVQSNNAALMAGAGNIGSALMSGAANQGNALQNAGAARASGYVGSANAWNNALGGLASNIGGGLGHLAGGGQNSGTNYYPPAPASYGTGGLY